MTSAYYHLSPQDLRRPLAPSTPIRDGAALPGSVFQETNREGTRRRFGNSENNQRLSFPLRFGSQEPVSESPLPEHVTPQYVVAGADRVIVQALEGWLLFDERGNLLSQGSAGVGDLSLDTQTRLFYAVTDTGNVGAFSLEDGTRKFYLTPFFGGEFSRDFIQDLGGQVLIASAERERRGNYRMPAKLSVVEIQDLSRKHEVDVSGWLESAVRTEYLKRRTLHLRVAMHANILVLAADDSLNFADSALGLQREFTGSFHPLWLSLDEELRCYMIVRTENRLALWVVTANGERVVNVVLPNGILPVGPPVVGHDHTAYVVGRAVFLPSTN